LLITESRASVSYENVVKGSPQNHSEWKYE